jgi:two-component system response regulator DevR
VPYNHFIRQSSVGKFLSGFEEIVMSISPSSDNEQAFSKLSHQEKYALFLLSEGRSDQEIAKALFLGEGTIRNYVNSILSKLELTNRIEAITFALKHNLKGHMGFSD